MPFTVWPSYSRLREAGILLVGTLVFLNTHPSFAQAGGSGLVAAYAFDEGSGTTVKDSSGNSLTGTIVGATWISGGMYGNALSFNGTSSYIDLGNPAALQLTGSMTLEAWVKATANPADDGQIVSKSNGTGWQLKTTPDTGPHTFGVAVSGSSTSLTQRYSKTVRSLNTWYHVAGVYDVDSRTLSTYVNGVLDNGTLKGVVPTSQFNRNVNVNIGRRSGGFYFKGVIDEVRIYNRALSQAEIQIDMSTSISGTSQTDTTPPTVSIASPVDGATVMGTTPVSAAASDDVGVAGVQFLLDSANLGNEVLSSPFTLQWNTTTASIGVHNLAAIARDFSGNTATSSSIAVTVSNPSPAQVGQWSAVMNWPMVAVHAEMLPTGDVLGWTDYTINGGAQIWRRATNTFTDKDYSTTSLFCSGHAYMADGRLLVVGGIVGLQDDHGPQNGTIFNPVTETWGQSSNMVTGRYYPTATTLPDGRILVQGGTTTCGTCVADMPEIYDPVSNTWTQLAASAKMAFKYYPHPFVLPDGRVLVASEDDKAISSRVLDLNTQTWTTVDPRVFDGHSAAMYQPGKIVKAGTATADNPGHPAAATAYILDMNQSSPAWQQTGSMAFPRSFLNLTLLPDGTVLATGGSTTTDLANFFAAVYEAEIWSPVTQSWTTMARMQTPRLYHSTAVLLPDASVLVAGGGRQNGRSQPDPKDEANAEIFSPPYLFRGPRPIISSAPSIIQYGTTFSVATPDAARVASVSLIALSAVTHAFNENQRFIPLVFEQVSGVLNVHAPASGNLAPPGPHMLFLVDTNGVPSVAAMVRLPAPNSSSNPAPTVTSITPNTGTANGATSVTITGTGFLAGATVSLGGTAATGVNVTSSTSITATTPAHAAGAVTVVVTNTDAQSGSLNNGYTYSNAAPTVTSITPNTGSAAGGTSVTITGTGFLAGATVSLGGTAATGVNVAGSTSITATTSAHAGGAVNVVVTNTDAQNGLLTNGYTYTASNPAPTVTSITPNTGSAAGGTSVTIAGSGFVAGATVRLGGTAATAVNVVSSTSITATTPAHAAGAVSVVVTNSDAQSGLLNNGYTYTTSTGGGPITFVQVKSATPQTASASVAVTYPIAQTSGNLNIVAVGWNDTTSTVTGITDSHNNTYVLAIGPTTGTGLRQSIYYAKNIAAGGNTVTVTFSKAAAFVDVRALEYSGLDTANPLDKMAGAVGSGTTASSGAVTTTAANELIFGAGMTIARFTGAGSGFVSRIITSPDADIAEDRTVTATGSYSATAPNSSSNWVMQIATFNAKP
jgi:hypothetical protein